MLAQLEKDVDKKGWKRGYTIKIFAEDNGSNVLHLIN